jgi:hypothetical protein
MKIGFKTSAASMIWKWCDQNKWKLRDNSRYKSTKKVKKEKRALKNKPL